VQAATASRLAEQYYGFYAQDSWRATRNLTLNYGLRWEVASPGTHAEQARNRRCRQQSLAFPGAPWVWLSRRSWYSRTLGPPNTPTCTRSGLLMRRRKRRFFRKLLGGAENQHTAGYGISIAPSKTHRIRRGRRRSYGNYYSSHRLNWHTVCRSAVGNPPTEVSFVFPPTNVSPRIRYNFQLGGCDTIGGSDITTTKTRCLCSGMGISFQRQLGTATCSA